MSCHAAHYDGFAYGTLALMSGALALMSFVVDAEFICIWLLGRGAFARREEPFSIHKDQPHISVFLHIAMNMTQ